MSNRRKTKSERELLADIHKRTLLFCNDNYDYEEESCKYCLIEKEANKLGNCCLAYIQFLLKKEGKDGK